MLRFRTSKYLDKHFYHFYARFADGLTYNQSEIWNQLVKALGQTLKQSGGDLCAFVLMGNHFHGVIRIKPDCRNLWRQDLLPLIPIPIEEEIHLILVDSHYVLLQTLKYIYQNPVEAGLVNAALEFPFSTYREIVKPRAYPELAKFQLIYDPLHLMLRPWIVGT